MRLDSFTKNSIIMFAASSIGSFFNLLYQWVILRAVSPEAFASLNTLLSLLVIFLFPVNSFVTMVTKQVSGSHARQDMDMLRGVWQVLARHAFIFSTVIFLLISFFSAAISRFLRIESQLSLVILGTIIFTSGIASVLTGGLQGLEKFKLLALISLAGGVLKLLSPFLFLKIFPQLESALLGFLVALLAGIILSLRPIWPLTGGGSFRVVDVKGLYLYIFPVMLTTLLFLLFTNFDMVLVKHFFPQESQEYAVAQMFGKIVLFLPGFIYMVMFARACSLHAEKRSSIGILKRTMFFVLLIGLGAALLFNFFPEFVFDLLARRHTPQIIFLGRIFSLSMVIFGMTNALFYYQLSVERYNFIFPSCLVALAAFSLLWFWHASIVWVAGMMLIAALCVFMINLQTTLRVETG